MDEPFVGLDPKAVFDMKEIMKQMCKEGKQYFSQHILEVAEKLCSRVAIIKQRQNSKSRKDEWELRGDESLEHILRTR